MLYSTVSFRMSLSDLAKYSYLPSVVNMTSFAFITLRTIKGYKLWRFKDISGVFFLFLSGGHV